MADQLSLDEIFEIVCDAFESGCVAFERGDMEAHAAAVVTHRMWSSAYAARRSRAETDV
jgi:hypothetical protein